MSSEWLLDNAYLIQEQINDIRRSLPQRYYEELPVVAGGPQAGVPRVYRIASEIVAESDGALDAEIIRNFLVAFQTAAPLKIGELWAMPPMLRLRLIECLRSLAIEVEQLQRGSEEADFWANRLITAARRSPERLLKMTEELVQRHPQPTAHFASELVAHLYDEEAPLPIVTSWLERSLRAPLLEVVQQEHRRQAVQQASLSNVIGSCRRLAQIQWGELFEAVSRADVELAKDPAGVYPRIDFETRNRYRDAVEQLAKWSKRSELEIIDRGLALAAAAEDEVERHIGYYLIDDGRPALEREAGCRVPLRELRAALASFARRGVLFRKHFPAHRRGGGRPSRAHGIWHAAIRPLSAQPPPPAAGQRAGCPCGELPRDVAASAAGAAENVLQERRHS